MGCNDHEISILITDNDQIRGLNKQYRKKDAPTNVLAFPMQEGAFTDITPGLIGDVVISCETAQQEADNAGIKLEERMSQLLIHGVLHLIGFDHEISEADAEKMEKKSLTLLRKIEPNTDLNQF